MVYTRATVMLAGVILAGGHSRRMGRNKALLPVGDRTLVEIVAARVGDACGQPPLLVTNTAEDYARTGLRCIPDALPSGHPLVGVYSGLRHVSGPAFVCACDMPFLSAALIRHMAALTGDVDVVIPRHRGEYEPLHAIYTPACLPAIEQCIARGARTAGLLASVRVRIVEEDDIRRFDPELASFVNVNTPEEYAVLLERLAAS